MSSYENTWDQMVNNPPGAYKELFSVEKQYLRDNIKPTDSVLDIGCGNGRNMLSLVDIAKDITGLDNNEKAVADAKENLKDYPHAHVVLGDAFNLPFPDNTFDVTFLLMTLVNFEENKTKALDEMRRVTKNDGKIIISVYSEKALEERLAMYKSIDLEILKETEGRIKFKLDDGTVSEQFSLNQLKDLVSQSQLEIVDYTEVPNLAYICTLKITQ